MPQLKKELILTLEMALLVSREGYSRLTSKVRRVETMVE